MIPDVFLHQPPKVIRDHGRGPARRRLAPGLVPEVADAGEVQADAGGVGGRDDLVVPD